MNTRKQTFNEFSRLVFNLAMGIMIFWIVMCLIEPIFADRFRWRGLIVSISLLLMFYFSKRIYEKGPENTKLYELIVIHLLGFSFIFAWLTLPLSAFVAGANLLIFLGRLAHYRVLKKAKQISQMSAELGSKP